MVAPAMSDQMPQFHGLEPWPPNVEVVECVVPGRTYDLHNNCTLEESAITCAPTLELWLRFIEDGSGRRLALGFIGVEQLTFQQDDRATAPGLWAPAEVETFIGAEYVTSANAAPRFTVETIVGTYAFACRLVTFHTESEPSGHPTPGT